MQLKTVLGKGILGALVGIALLTGLPVAAHAEHGDRCRRDVEKAEHNLAKEVRKHGEHSRQAEERRRQLEAVHARCH
jgi:3-hydroxyacyl-CoA dehydrogenase